MIQSSLGSMRYRISFATGLSNVDYSQEQGLIDGYLNEGYVRFLDRTRCHTECAHVTAHGGDVSIEEFPILLIDNVTYDDGTPLMRLDREELMRLRAGSSQSPSYAAAGANRLMICPAPSSGSFLKLHIYYVPVPGTLVNAGDEPVYIPPEYRHALESYAKWKIGSTDEHRGSQIGAQWKAEWDEALMDCKASIWRTGGRVREGMAPLVR